jgi:hypothetical protein
MLLETNMTPLRYIHWLFCNSNANPETVSGTIAFANKIFRRGPTVRTRYKATNQLAKYFTSALIPKNSVFVFLYLLLWNRQY